MSLVTRNQLAAHLGRNTRTDENKFENWAIQAIAAVSDELASDRWCGQPLEYTTVTAEFLAPRGRRVLLYHPVLAVTTLEYRDDEFSAWTAVADADFTLELRGGVYSVVMRTAHFGRLYRATATVGYWPTDAEGSKPVGVSDVPLGLQQVALDMLTWRYEEAFGNRRGVKSESDAGAGVGSSLFRQFVSRSAKEAEWRRDVAPYRARMTI